MEDRARQEASIGAISPSLGPFSDLETAVFEAKSCM